jgi:hypothetical protein
MKGGRRVWFERDLMSYGERILVHLDGIGSIAITVGILRCGIVTALLG